MSQRLIGYQRGQGVVYQLSAVTKLLFFLLVSVTAMVTYDTRLIAFIAVASMGLFRLSGIRLKDVSVVLFFTILFALLNAVMVYLFSPQYGVELYGAKTVLWTGIGRYNLTSQQLFYLLNMVLKYFCTVPLALVFLMTTHPSQFASSLNQIGLSYKIAYAVSLTLRYIPDIQEEFFVIRRSQEARGAELSQKGNLYRRVRGNLSLIIPLIFTSLKRIDSISTAMELRRFGKNKKRTWYTSQPFRKEDVVVFSILGLLIGAALWLFLLNQGRFYNPWKS